MNWCIISSRWKAKNHFPADVAEGLAKDLRKLLDERDFFFKGTGGKSCTLHIFGTRFGSPILWMGRRFGSPIFHDAISRAVLHVEKASWFLCYSKSLSKVLCIYTVNVRNEYPHLFLQSYIYICVQFSPLFTLPSHRFTGHVSR